MSEYITVWQYWIKEVNRKEFEHVYGAEGAWVKLFQRAPGFIKTVLLQDCEDPSHYVTFDRWSSEQQYYAFMDKYAEDYRNLDERCSNVTTREDHIGSFTT